MAIDNYLSYNQSSVDATKARATSEFFARVKHGKKGVQRAYDLKNEIRMCNRKGNLYLVLHKLFVNKENTLSR